MTHHHHDQHSEHQAHAHAAHDTHAGHSVAMFRDKFCLSLLLTLPVMAYSHMIQYWLNFTPPYFPGSEYVPFVLSTIIFFYGGLVFIKGAWHELRGKLPGMMTLISLAIVTAYAYSVATQFFIAGDGFFWELATLVTIMLLGHWIEMASVARAENSLDALAKLLPDTAEKLVAGQPRTVPVSELLAGDLVLLRPAANIPVDGVVVSGGSSVDEAAITGESKPVAKSIDDKVVAGTANQEGSLTVKVTDTGDATVLAGIMRLVADAQSSKSNVQVLADKAAFVLTIIALVAGVSTFVYWAIAKDVSFALERAVTVLITACPHALGLAIPLVVAIATALSARHGLLIRQRAALESARRLDYVLFDKTGTLTKGKHGVTDIWATKGYTKGDILQIAASLEQLSEHIVGRGIVAKAKEMNMQLDAVTEFVALPGVGVRGSVGSVVYHAVSHRYIAEHTINVPKALAAAVKQASEQGKTEVYVVAKGRVVGAVALADVVREESRQAIATLHSMGIQTAMVTGDSRAVAAHIAAQLGIHEYFAEVRPQDKAAHVKQLQQTGARVAFVGDGINDAPALTQADVGIAIGAGTDVAVKSADIILVKNDPRDVANVIRLSRATYRKMIQNLLWATGYNVLAIPLAAGVLYGVGIVLAPAAGAVLMSASTVVVALNAQLLRRTRLVRS